MEMTQYRFMQDMFSHDVKMVSIFCDREHEHISSTAIRTLFAMSKEIEGRMYLHKF